MNASLRSIALAAASAAILATSTAGAARAQCTTGFWVLDLKTCANGVTAGFSGVTFLPGGACAAVGTPQGCSASAGWKSAALKIALPAGCRQANVDVEYEGTPCGWTVNLGDSSTNNGFAGGAGGTTLACAETQVLNTPLGNSGQNPLSTLSVYSSCQAGVTDNLASASLALKDGTLRFVVKDQFLSFGQPATVVQTPAIKRLYQLPDTLGPNADGSTIYLGLNRVIFGPGARIGYGARRVTISFQ